jgi:hypothetical protein
MDSIITALVDGIVVPVTGTIPLLASSGILLAAFVTIWIALGIALIRDRAALDRTWFRIRRSPLIAQGLLWLLFLPVLASLWIWRRGWHPVPRIGLMAGIAGWNLLVFMPRPV